MSNHLDPNDRTNGGFAQGKHTEEFSAYLQTLPNRKEVAACLRIPYSTFDNFLRGLQAFPPDLLPRLFACSGAKDLWAFFLDQVGMMAIPKPNPGRHVPATAAPDVYEHVMDSTASVMKARAAYKVAIKDGKIDAAEASRITYFGREAQRELAAMEED